MPRTLTWTAAQADAGSSVKHFLRARGCTSAVLTALKKREDALLLNGEAVFVNAVIAPGDRIDVTLRDETDSALPEPLGIPVVWEDDDLIVYDKPAGIAVHPTKKIQSGTLANDFAYRARSTGEHAVFRPVYRLDRGTTGLVVAAKHKFACAMLTGRIIKEYVCLCSGILPDSGVFDGPIALEEEGRLRRVVRADGKPSLTRFVREAHGADWSLARVWTETGRTHQIRCHFAHAGHPLLGDFLYGVEMPDWARPALHCERIRFDHPVTGAAVSLTAPMPDDMSGFINIALRRR